MCQTKTLPMKNDSTLPTQFLKIHSKTNQRFWYRCQRSLEEKKIWMIAGFCLKWFWMWTKTPFLEKQMLEFWNLTKPLKEMSGEVYIKENLFLIIMMIQRYRSNFSLCLQMQVLNIWLKWKNREEEIGIKLRFWAAEIKFYKIWLTQLD